MKIGILTHYYKSVNYGGNLQAFALCRALSLMGYECEQVSYDSTYGNHRGRLRRLFALSPRRFFQKIASRLFKKRSKTPPEVLALLEKRKRAIRAFNEGQIPHSETVYNLDTVKEAAKLYDAFITGSDQVFTRGAVCPAYLLSFLPEGKKRFSYAASMAQKSLTKQEERLFRSAFSSYSGLSVREESTLSLLSPLYAGQTVLSLDPTLLLAPSVWEALCPPRMVEEKYLFCYFLGKDKGERELASAYAKEKGLSIVTLPHLSGAYCQEDEGFGDRALYEVSPVELLSLIRHADAVFTDSFHATVFSGIFKKPYFTFERAGNREAGTRIETLASLFGHVGRFCDSEEKRTLSYLLSAEELNYGNEMKALSDARRASEAYLFDMLRGVKGEA